MPSPYMTDPALLDSLRGQQYVVLRPHAEVADFYVREQSAVLARVPSLPHPNSGHVTLRGFFEPERVEALRDRVRSWGAGTPAIELRIEAVDGFPPPFQVVIARLTRRDSLVDAYTSLTEVLDSTDFRRIGELPLDEWVFHLSVAYAGELDGPGWDALLSGYQREIVPAPAECVSSVDFVWYDDDGEHTESIPLQEP